MGDDAQDLDALLDSALEDFAANEASAAEPSSSGGGGGGGADALEKGLPGGIPAGAMAEMLAADGMTPPEGIDADAWANELAESMVKLMAELGGPDAEAAAGSTSAAGEPSDEFKKTVSKTLEALSDSAKQMEQGLGGGGGEGADEMMSKLMEQFQNMGDDPNLEGMMEGMMQQLLSKDFLHSPLVEIRDKYPQWLEAHKSELTAEDNDRYNKQYALVCEIVHTYETDADNVTKVIELMQQMQECGQPPAEIVQELAPGLEFGADGLPKMPGGGALDPANCTVM